MLKNKSSARVNTFLRCFLCQSLLPSVIIMLTGLLTNALGQVAIPLVEINPQLNEILTMDLLNFTDIEAIDDQLFIGTSEGLWVLSKDGKQATQVISREGEVDKFNDADKVPFGSRGGMGTINSTAKGGISGLGVVGKRLFVFTYAGAWIVDKDGRHATKVEQVKGKFEQESYGAIILGERIFIATDEGLWVVSNDGAQVDKIENIKQLIHSIETGGGVEEGIVYRGRGVKLFSKYIKPEGQADAFNSISTLAIGKQLFAETDNGIWVINQDGSRATRVEAIKSKTAIRSMELVGEQLFVQTDADTLYLINKDSGQATEIVGIPDAGYLRSVKVSGHQIYVCGDQGLWTFNTDTTRVAKVEGIPGKVDYVLPIGEQLLASTPQGVWLVDKDSLQATQIKDIKDDFVYSGSEAVGEEVFVCGNNYLWIASKDGSQATKVASIEPVNPHIMGLAEHVYIEFRKRGKNSGYNEYSIIYRIDRKNKISTKLSPSGWWTTLISYALSSNSLPVGKVGAEAFYSDEEGVDPYDRVIPREFRFAKADGDAMPSDDKFSTAEQFNYEVGLGENKVHYWVKDKWGNTFEQKAVYRGVPSQYFIAAMPFTFSIVFVLVCFVLAPKVGFCHSAIMNPWLRKYFSLGSVPLLLSTFPSLRSHILRRYSNSINNDRDFTEWKKRFVYPDENLLPENFGKKVESERKILFTGQSGIGKTSFFKHLTAYYVSQSKPQSPAKVFPVYIPLINYGSNSLEDLVYNQLFSYGKITDKELSPMFLEQGGLLIFLDGVNEVQTVADRQKLAEFVEKFWKSNYICLSSQQSYPELENLPKIELKTFGPEKICELIRQRVNDKENAEYVIKKLTDEDYQLYSVPRDLEFAIEIINSGEKSLPGSRTELYKIVFSSLFAKWKKNGAVDAGDTLCKHAYSMIVQRDLVFDSVDNPVLKEITSDLFEQKFLVRREKSYNFRHDLIRSYLASEYFYPRWKNLFKQLNGKVIDSNWLEMLKFSCENIEDSNEVKSLVYEVLEKSVRKDVVKQLFEWLTANHQIKCKSWENDFYTKYGKLDFN